MKTKTYFAKYLPVEGEMKEGGKYITNCGNVYNADKESIEAHKELEKSQGKKVINDYFKPVKLFLCSRDIQVGDKVVQDKEKPFNPDSLAVIDKEHLEMHKMYGHFKVIGEVSPDAIWVTENMEFGEESVRKRVSVELYYADAKEQFQYYENLIRVESEFKPIDRSDYNETILNSIIVIKCPTCLTYH